MMNQLSRKEIKEMLRNAEKLPPEEVKELVTLLQKMPVELSQKEIETMSGNPGKERYIYSLKRIAEQKVAWTLKDSEEIMTTVDDNGDQFIHIWPYKEFAVSYKKYAEKSKTDETDEWGKLDLFKLPLSRLMKEILPSLSEKGVMIAVFMVPNDPFVIAVPADDFLNNLLYERSKYE